VLADVAVEQPHVERGGVRPDLRRRAVQHLLHPAERAPPPVAVGVEQPVLHQPPVPAAVRVPRVGVGEQVERAVLGGAPAAAPGCPPLARRRRLSPSGENIRTCLSRRARPPSAPPAPGSTNRLNVPRSTGRRPPCPAASTHPSARASWPGSARKRSTSSAVIV